MGAEFSQVRTGDVHGYLPIGCRRTWLERRALVLPTSGEMAATWPCLLSMSLLSH